MSRRIGWYVHHHGRGHLTRLVAVAGLVDAEIVCFSSRPQPDDLPPNCAWVPLERDDDFGGRDPADRDPTAQGVLHWVPLDHAGHRSRLMTIVASAGPLDGFVVDVSVEVTVLARLLGIPVAVFTQPGERDDPAHRLAFSLATTVIAPWPAEGMPSRHLAAAADRVVFTGGISRFDGRSRPESPNGGVLVLAGAGGSPTTARDVARAAEATGRPWRMLGGAEWVSDPWDELTGAEVVVSWAGQNAVADLAASHARAVVIPQDRPFEEQRATARALENAGLAVVSDRWPEPSEWPALLRRAESLRPDWARWRVEGAASRAARAIEAVCRS